MGLRSFSFSSSSSSSSSHAERCVSESASVGSWARVVFVRHGQSEWNEAGRFTGWEDIGLTEEGRREAELSGEELARSGISLDCVFASALSRSQETAEILLQRAGQRELEIVTDWRLNERHYGALQGKHKEEATREFGQAQVKLWRNSFDVPPPKMPKNSPKHPANDLKYAGVPPSLLPDGECLRDTLHRCLPFWNEVVKPELQKGRTVGVVAHGHSIRALVKNLDDISDDDIARVSMPNGIPLLYNLDRNLKPMGTSPRSSHYDDLADDEIARRNPSAEKTLLLRATFLGDESDLNRRLKRDTECLGDECPLPDSLLHPEMRSEATEVDTKKSAIMMDENAMPRAARDGARATR